jgi:hypothetical protein
VQTATSGGSTLIEISRIDQSVQGVSLSLVRLLKQATVALVLGLSASRAPAEDVSGSEATVESAAAETSILEDLEQRLANQNEAGQGGVLDEARWVRLGNGTRLTDPGSLAAGVTVNGFDYYLYTAFLVAKYRGMSVNSEFYYRWLNNFDTAGGPVTADIDTRGFVVDVGVMLVEKSIELMGRIDAVHSAFGDTWEYAAGINWFINGTHRHKLTFDVADLNGVPAGSSSPNYELGQVGTLFRVQYQVAF